MVKIYLDGKYVSEDEAKISVFDHGLLYGDGVFEGIRLYGGRIFRLEQHLDRLFASAKAIMLQIPLTREQIVEACCETCRQNKLKDGYIRLVVTRGVGYLGLNPFRCKNPTVFIIAGTIELYPEEVYRKGLKLITASTQRTSAAAVSPSIKSLNYLNNILAKIEAVNAGAVEAIFSILAIRDRVAPPTINLDNPSVETPIDLVPHQARQRELLGRDQLVFSPAFLFVGCSHNGYGLLCW